MNARLMCELLGRATATDDGKLELPDETAADSAVLAALGFLIEQRWLAEDGTATWTVTPSGRFWLTSLRYRDILKFHEYGGAVFLLHVISIRNETVVWHKGRFATIGIGFIPPASQTRLRSKRSSALRSRVAPVATPTASTNHLDSLDGPNERTRARFAPGR